MLCVGNRSAFCKCHLLHSFQRKLCTKKFLLCVRLVINVSKLAHELSLFVLFHYLDLF